LGNLAPFISWDGAKTEILQCPHFYVISRRFEEIVHWFGYMSSAAANACIRDIVFNVFFQNGSHLGFLNLNISTDHMDQRPNSPSVSVQNFIKIGQMVAEI